jgi:hypothetical protein
MDSFPDFKKIFNGFRTEKEIKEISNSAFFKLLAFAGISFGMMIARKMLNSAHGINA